jgi:hypothetical protein
VELHNNSLLLQSEGALVVEASMELEVSHNRVRGEEWGALQLTAMNRIVAVGNSFESNQSNALRLDFTKNPPKVYLYISPTAVICGPGYICALKYYN